MRMKVLSVLSRVYVRNMDEAVIFYEELLGQSVNRRFSMPHIGLELASIGPLLIIAGSEEALAPYKSTNATFLVDDLDAYYEHLTAKGANVLRAPQPVPTGRNMTIQHPDGTIIEYVEHTA